MKKVRTKLKFNIAFHSQTDGQTKRGNGTLNQYLINYLVVDHKDWGQKFDLVEFYYNFTKHSMTCMSPFELTLGMDVKQPLNLVIPHIMKYYRDGDKNAKIMAEGCKKLNVHIRMIWRKPQQGMKNRLINL
jgi:hypothetical protein